MLLILKKRNDSKDEFDWESDYAVCFPFNKKK